MQNQTRYPQNWLNHSLPSPWKGSSVKKPHFWEVKVFSSSWFTLSNQVTVDLGELFAFEAPYPEGGQPYLPTPQPLLPTLRSHWIRLWFPEMYKGPKQPLPDAELIYMHPFQRGWNRHCFQSPNVIFKSFWQNLISWIFSCSLIGSFLHSVCALYVSMKRLVKSNHKQTEQMGLLEKRTFLMEALIFWQLEKILFKDYFPCWDIWKNSYFHFIVSAYWVFILSKKERKKIPCSTNPSVVIFHENKMHRKIWLNTLHSRFLHLWTVTSHKTPSCIDNLLK